MIKLYCLETVLRGFQVAVVSFLLNAELVGDSVTNSEQHGKLTENKLLVS